MVHCKTWGRIQRHRRIRKKIFGTAERPRVAVRRSLNHLFVQAVDDGSQKTVAAFSSQSKEFLKTAPQKGKITVAVAMGKKFAEELKKKGVTKISFDRGGYLYHGRVKALAESIRQSGIQF